MIQVANRPCDEVALEWPIYLHLESLIQDVILYMFVPARSASSEFT